MRVILALSFLLLAGCQTTGGMSTGAALPDVGGVEQSWAHSQIVIPATRVKSNWPEEIAPWADPSGWQDYVRGELKSPNAKLPAVVYAHGCSGLPANAEFVDFLARLGFAVFAPNSFGRTGRKQHCYQQQGTPTYAYRQEEITYALARVREIPWIDQDNIVLVGHSEGGEAAGEWNERGFRAIVISGADCRTPSTNGSPLAPSDIPLLSIIGAKDTRQFPGCSVAGRGAGSKTVIVSGAGHSVYRHKKGQAALAAFLKACCGG